MLSRVRILRSFRIFRRTRRPLLIVGKAMMLLVPRVQTFLLVVLKLLAIILVKLLILSSLRLTRIRFLFLRLVRRSRTLMFVTLLLMVSLLIETSRSLSIPLNGRSLLRSGVRVPILILSTLSICRRRIIQFRFSLMK